jgi:hypothetical protein
MHFDDLRSKVLSTRPGSDASIYMLLNRNPERFRKVMLHIYALTSWGDSVSSPEGFSRTDVAAFVKDYFESRGIEEAEFGELSKALCTKTGLQRGSARGILAQHPAVVVRSPDSNRRIARYDPSWESKPRRTILRSKPLLSETVVDAVIVKLKNAPTGERPLIELVRELESELGVIRPSVYAAIDQSDEIEKISVDGSVFKICRLVGRSFAQFPQLASLRNLSWREECERAVKRLNVDDVDLALFQLGRQFDQAMCQLLEHARDKNGAEVSDGHLKTLQTRIDWSVKNQLFNDKATLNLLRVERNERGHQPPTHDERKAIMKFAPFLAELYIDYLILIDAQMGKQPAV